MNLYGEKVSDISFPKFKEMYKERLEELSVPEGTINYILRSKNFQTMRNRVFSGCREIELYISCRVLDNLCKELNIRDMGVLVSPKGGKDEYLRRVGKVLKNLK
jgi:hypothetical protein